MGLCVPRQEGSPMGMGAGGSGQWAGIDAPSSALEGSRGQWGWRGGRRKRHPQGTAQQPRQRINFPVLRHVYSLSPWWDLLFKQPSC